MLNAVVAASRRVGSYDDAGKLMGFVMNQKGYTLEQARGLKEAAEQNSQIKQAKYSRLGTEVIAWVDFHFPQLVETKAVEFDPWADE